MKLQIRFKVYQTFNLSNNSGNWPDCLNLRQINLKLYRFLDNAGSTIVMSAIWSLVAL